MKYAVVYTQGITSGRDQGYPETMVRLFTNKRLAKKFLKERDNFFPLLPTDSRWSKPAMYVQTGDTS